MPYILDGVYPVCDLRNANARAVAKLSVPRCEPPRALANSASFRSGDTEKRDDCRSQRPCRNGSPPFRLD